MKRFRTRWFWWCAGVGLIVIALIWTAYRFSWPGTGFQGKTVWDWLQLLIIPAALALIALLFNQANTRAERGIAQKRYEQDKEIAEQRYEQDQKIALDKQREDLLQAYLDRMSELLLEKGLRTSPSDAEVRNVAQTRTISVLWQLDVRRVGYVFAFLRDSRLMDVSDPVVSLRDVDLSKVEWHAVHLAGANLSGANLSGANLYQANLSKTNLAGANLSGADLAGANLNGTNLNGANLSETNLSLARVDYDPLVEYIRDTTITLPADLRGANLFRAILAGAILPRANLSGANLTEANLSEALLAEADLRGACLDRTNLSEAFLAEADLRGANASIWEANFSNALLGNANLSEASLPKANLNGAKLFLADLSGANLSGANLSGADLSGANLSGVWLKDTRIDKGQLTSEQIAQAFWFEKAQDGETQRGEG